MNNLAQTQGQKFISHGAFQTVSESSAEIKTRLYNRGLSDGELQNCEQILQELQLFELGRSLLVERGLNAFWMQYVISYPQHGKITGLSSDGSPLTTLERWILESSPIVVSAQDRYFKFQKLLVENLRNNMTMASIPCGYMDDLLGLDYSDIRDFKLFGVDIDPSAIKGARLNAEANNLAVEFINCDAWALNADSKFDLITSHGLTIYESDHTKLEELLNQFNRALKKDGVLITSFLMSDGAPFAESAPKFEDIHRQQLVMSEVLNMKWQACSKTKLQIDELLQRSGFGATQYHYDRFASFPSVYARKL